MTARLADMPVMAQRPDTIDAKIFNLWRRTRLKVNNPVCLKLPGLKTMRLVLDDEHWVVADSANYYVPIIAWTNFETQNRTNLHKPIKCRTKYYHFAASAVRGRVLALMVQMLEQGYAGNSDQSDRHPKTNASVHNISDA